MNKLEIIRNMGAGWFLYRSYYELRKKLGFLEREYPIKVFNTKDFFASMSISEEAKSIEGFINWWKVNHKQFFPSLNENQAVIDIELVGDREQIIARANEICLGEFVYFNKWRVKYKEIDWHYNPITGKHAPKGMHWVKIPDLTGEFGDIKYIWELSRFSFAYTLVRAFALTNDSKYVEKFWEITEDWIEKNPNQLGVNYKCCQEMSIRLMAWIFALYAFKDHPSSTDDRIFKLLKSIYLHSEHIEKHFEFSLRAVKNNHTITEAVAMYTVGVLFPFFNGSKRWRKKGLKHLQQEAMNQIYEDGSYLQHSSNYHRLMLQDYTWAIQLGKLHGENFSPSFLERVNKAIKFLYSQQITENGRVPNYGMNDGALIHPLSTCDYLDYRPQLQTAYYVINEKRLYEPGPYDENLYWICGSKALEANVDILEKKSASFPVGGYYLLKGPNSKGTIRCTTYKHRPFQADMLSLDLWYGMDNILTDAGTFSYNTDEKWLNYFNGTRSHNTIMINEQNQMEKGSRFIWYKWTKSKLIGFQKEVGYTIFEGEHYGYAPYTCRRAVCNIGDVWIVIDDIYNQGQVNDASIVQQWLFGLDHIKIEDNRIEVPLEQGNIEMIFLDQNISEIRSYYGDEESARGWTSFYYGEKQSAWQVTRSLNIQQNIRLITCIKPKDYSINVQDASTILLENYELKMMKIGEQKIVQHIQARG